MTDVRELGTLSFLALKQGQTKNGDQFLYVGDREIRYNYSGKEKHQERDHAAYAGK